MKSLSVHHGWLPLAALLAGGCVSGTDIDQIQHQLAEVQDSLEQIRSESSSMSELAALSDSVGSQSEALRRSEAEIAVGLEDLGRRLDELWAKLEDTNYRLAQLSQQLATTNQELKSRREQAAPRAEAGDAIGGGTAAPSDPQTLYQAAYNDYLRGNYDLAVLTFRQYLESFPETELADNAAYWIGESYFSQGKYQQAIREFGGIVERYPRSDKLASVLLKTGYAYLELGNQSQGVEQLRLVIRDFPGSDEANLGAQRLRTLGVDSG